MQKSLSKNSSFLGKQGLYHAIYQESLNITKELLYCLFASLFLALSAQITIPWLPIPFTAQPQAIFYLCLVFGRKRAFASICLYLLEGIYGLPVFANAGWGMLKILGPSGGYLLSFPLIALIFSSLLKRQEKNFLFSFLSLNAASLFLISCGTGYLCLMLPIKEAIDLGFMPFVLAEIIKNAFLATYLRYHA